MLLEVRIVPNSFTIERELPNQPRFYQSVKRVVNRGPRRARMAPVQSKPQILSRSVIRRRQQMLHDEKSLGRAADAEAKKRCLYRLSGICI